MATYNTHLLSERTCRGLTQSGSSEHLYATLCHNETDLDDKVSSGDPLSFNVSSRWIRWTEYLHIIILILRIYYIRRNNKNITTT